MTTSANVPRGTIEPPSAQEELHIIRKLGMSPGFFCGAITPRERGERLAKHLAEKCLGRVPVWRNRDETWNEAVLRWYGVAPISTDSNQQP